MALARRCSALALALVASLALGSPALAHNHLLNPSGQCNNSGQGTSPGNSGETNLNPAGKPNGNSNSNGKGGENCKNGDPDKQRQGGVQEF